MAALPLHANTQHIFWLPIMVSCASPYSWCVRFMVSVWAHATLSTEARRHTAALHVGTEQHGRAPWTHPGGSCDCEVIGVLLGEVYMGDRAKLQGQNTQHT